MKARVPRPTGKQVHELKAIHDIARAIASSLTLDQRLEALMARLGPAAGAERAMVSLLDAEDPNVFRLRLAYDATRADMWLRHLDLSSERYPEIREVVRTRQPLVIPDVFAEPLLASVRKDLEVVNLRSLVVGPLVVRERVIGALSLGYVGQGRTFSTAEIRFYQSMADLAAAAIANAQLYDQVAQGKAEWENTFDAISDLMAIVDGKGRFLHVNRAMAQRLGVAPAELIGRRCGGLLQGTRFLWPGSPHARPLIAGGSTTSEVEDPELGGIFLFTNSPLLDGEGRVLGSVLIARDITEIKRLEEEAKERQRFEDLSRAKSAFIATMSHELRGPLNAILGFSEALVEKWHGPLNERQEQHVALIRESGEHLLHLINDILDVSRAEAGKIELALEPVALEPIAEAVLNLIHPQAEDAGVTVRSEIPSGLPPVLADQVRLKQILFNLLTNAVKFTPPTGTITVTARRVNSPSGAIADSSRPIDNSTARPIDDRDFVEIAVTDSGIGIMAEDIPKLFKEFSQLEAGRAPEKRGTGLGLSITKKLVELHGGRICVESEGDGRGSVFRFTLPLAPEGEDTKSAGDTACS
jgi:signal transduction histidine kinase